MGVAASWRRKLKSLFLAIAGLFPLAIPAGAVEPFAAECKLTLAASVPITLAHSHVEVPVTINGRGRTFLIDTGAFTSAVSEQVVAEQQIRTFGIHDNVHIDDAGGKKAELYVDVDEFVIANQKAHDARMMVMNAAGVDGLVGPDYLRNFDLDFDFANGTLNLFRHHPCHGRAVYWTDDYFVVPIDVTDDGHIRVDVTLDGKPMRALLDTGAAVTVLGQSVAETDFGLEAGKSNLDAAGLKIYGPMMAAGRRQRRIVGFGAVPLRRPADRRHQYPQSHSGRRGQ